MLSSWSSQSWGCSVFEVVSVQYVFWKHWVFLKTWVSSKYADSMASVIDVKRYKLWSFSYIFSHFSHLLLSRFFNRFMENDHVGLHETYKVDTLWRIHHTCFWPWTHLIQKSLQIIPKSMGQACQNRGLKPWPLFFAWSTLKYPISASRNTFFQVDLL